VDISAWLNFATFDMIGDLTFGEPFNCLRDSCFHPWIHFLFSRLTMMMYGQMITTMGYFGALLEFMVPKHIKNHVLHHVATSKDMVNRRRTKDTDRPDFMRHMLNYTGKEGGLSDGELYADAQFLVMAGSEATASNLTSCVYYLLKNPDVLRKLQDEVRPAFASASEIKFATAAKLPYVGAVINETLRIRHPLPIGVHRIVPAGGALVDGRFVPGGANVVVSHWAAYRSAANFRDPDTFAPERWLNDERYAADNREVFQPFSFGARNCIGRSLAFIENRVLLAQLIWNFDLELMPDSWNWETQNVYLLWEKRPLNVRMTVVERVVER